MTIQEAREIEVNKENKLLEYWKQEMDKSIVELKTGFNDDALNRYTYAKKKYNEVKEKYDNCDQFPLETAVILYNQMSCKLVYEFDAICDKDEGTIRFKWWGRSSNFIIHMLASYFSIKPYCFGFESGFTTNEVLTEGGYHFHMGIDPKYTDMILINFHFKTAGDISIDL